MMKVVKKEIEKVELEGLGALLGEIVLLMCANYFYAGELIGVNDTCVLLKDPKIVYDTGKWDADGWQNAQSLCVPEWYIQKEAIESFGAVSK
jgi:hypothetical protein